ncbi:Retinol-binding protein pinta [Gryllus bimaculatus]|nr:Retinol-binding protein pinta [Gryllus bimaculatus]
MTGKRAVGDGGGTTTKCPLSAADAGPSPMEELRPRTSAARAAGAQDHARMDPETTRRIANCRLAQEALERYLLLRQTYGQAFRNLDITLPTMDYLATNGYLFACPERDRLGRRVVVARPGVFDPYKFTNEDMCRYHGIAYETLMEDEENQIRGYNHFNDGQGVGFHYLTLFTPKEAVRIVKNGERTLPMRHKEVHVINVPPGLKFALDFGMSLISDKIKQRVKIYTSLEKAKEALGEDCKVLPKEYGGTMPMEEMIALWKKELMASRALLLSHDEMGVREELFSPQAREGAVSALRANTTSCALGMGNSDMLGISGSFRKLEVD